MLCPTFPFFCSFSNDTAADSIQCCYTWVLYLCTGNHWKGKSANARAAWRGLVDPRAESILCRTFFLPLRLVVTSSLHQTSATQAHVKIRAAATRSRRRFSSSTLRSIALMR